ncbi:DsbA family protein [Mucilaginibacter sp. FT3.2]|uniref:DsbA family protein n=1 Tax=Mucilaginibacter sp. FT3.2 TaxID=2723090 RepID=UPI00161E89B3|nr:thioredoxin domain-containing protein [Mucilaginibacter sp. FT3.2]MBB6235121.1 protein-disulfide isomerase [Mucilaginibacter sp. FT3.2]
MKTELIPAVNPGDHSIGDADAAIEIVEYGDFECPDCGNVNQLIKQIRQEFGSQIRFIFRNFPLTEIHPYAMPVALVAEAAGLQNKYWEMHNLIFQHQGELNDALFEQLANKIGLNVVKFEHDLQTTTLQDKVSTDFESGLRSGVNGTPTFFVNGQKFDGGVFNLLEILRENTN